MKKILTILCAMACVGSLLAQTFTITDSMQWKAYDDFDSALLDKTRNIYKADKNRRLPTTEATEHATTTDPVVLPPSGVRLSITICSSMPTIVLRPKVMKI